MTWILTHSGKRVDLLLPDPETLDIEDVAHALARLCRFTGHTSKFYSVAQHSVLVAESMPKGSSKALRRSALLHDAMEAYLGDCSSPLKMAMRLPSVNGGLLASARSPYDVLEERFWASLALKYDLAYDPAIKHADLVLLATERRDLMPAGGPPWGTLPPPLDMTINPWSVGVAEGTFLGMWEELAA